MPASIFLSCRAALHWLAAGCPAEGWSPYYEGKEENTPMNEYAKKSILEMARGGFLEVTDLEMTKAIANIMDPNTSATAKRKITVTIELKADDSRQNIGVSYTVKSALAPTNAVTTMLYVADEDNVVEMVPQIPGQFGINGTEQEAPPALKLVKFA